MFSHAFMTQKIKMFTTFYLQTDYVIRTADDRLLPLYFSIVDTRSIYSTIILFTIFFFFFYLSRGTGDIDNGLSDA